MATLNIPAKFHAAAVVLNPLSGQFRAEIQVKINDEVVTIFDDSYFDPVTALQALQKELVQVLNG